MPHHIRKCTNTLYDSFMSKFIGTGPSPYEKRIYRAAVSQRLRNTALQARISTSGTVVHYTDAAVNPHCLKWGILCSI
jgi:hypothetical protein